MTDHDSEESFDNPLDGALSEWCVALTEAPPQGLVHLSADDRLVLAAVVSAWQGMADPNDQGLNYCAQTSYLVRQLFAAVGVESGQVTVTVEISLAADAAVTIGNRHPKVRKLPNGDQFWTGHEIVYIPRWSVALDLTIGQASLLHPDLADIVIDPVGEKVDTTPRPRGTFTTAVIGADTGGPIGTATYTVCQPNYSYRDSRAWPDQQTDLDRAVADNAPGLKTALREFGISV